MLFVIESTPAGKAWGCWSGRVTVYWAPLKQKVQKQPVLKPPVGKFDSESKRDPMIVDFVVYILLSSGTNF